MSSLAAQDTAGCSRSNAVGHAKQWSKCRNSKNYLMVPQRDKHGSRARQEMQELAIGLFLLREKKGSELSERMFQLLVSHKRIVPEKKDHFFSLPFSLLAAVRPVVYEADACDTYD